MNLLKFASNKNILSEVVALGYNQVCSQILSFNKLYVFFFFFIKIKCFKSLAPNKNKK